jgi:hypothetical protein
MECDMRVVFRVAHGGGKKRVKYKEEKYRNRQYMNAYGENDFSLFGKKDMLLDRH